APGMFSTTTVPSVRLTLSAHGRPTMSNTPPGGNGRTRRIGRLGNVSARPRRGAAASAAIAAAQRKSSRRDVFNASSLVVFISAGCFGATPSDRLEIGELDDFRPFVGFVGNELTEVGGRHGGRQKAESV